MGRHGHPDAETRFFSNVMMLPDGCMVWTGAEQRYGYGNFTANGEAHSAQRWAWYFQHGYMPIKPMCLDHLCNNRWCVNAAHLEEVTYSENNRRARERRKKFRAHLNTEEVGDA